MPKPGDWLKDMAAKAKSGKYPKSVTYAPHVHYMRDDYNQAYRVWPCWYAGDSFYMIPIADMEQALPAIKAMSLFCEGYPEDDAGELTCPLCKRNETVA